MSCINNLLTEHFSIGLEVRITFRDVLHVIFLEVHTFLNLYVLSDTQLCKKKELQQKAL